jgi:hypothetical protein
MSLVQQFVASLKLKCWHAAYTTQASPIANTLTGILYTLTYPGILCIIGA